jgi:hypothetical protein
MFTIIACVAVIGVGYWTDRLSDKETVGRPFVFDDDLIRQSIVFARRDLRLIVWVLYQTAESLTHLGQRRRLSAVPISHWTTVFFCNGCPAGIHAG